MKRKNRIPNLPATLGDDKKYYLFFAQSPLSEIPFARKIQRLINKGFAFLGNFIPQKTEDELRFPLFFADIRHEWSEYLVMLPNHIPFSPVPHNRDEVLLGLSLFDDDRYLFNQQGQYLMKCDFIDYDYVFLLLSECEEPNDEIIDPLRNCKDLDLKEIGLVETNMHKNRTGNLSKATDEELLFNFFGDIEVLINDYRTEHLRRHLAPNQNLKAAGMRLLDIHNQRFIEADVWHDEEQL